MRRPSSITTRGALAGCLAATVLAVWFLIIDTLQGEPFQTPAFLASVVAGLEQVRMTTGLIVMYTALHYLVFLAVGVGIAWLLSRAEAVPGVLLGIVIGFLLFDLLFYGSVVATGVDVVRMLGWRNVLAGNILAGIALTVALRRTLPVPAVGWRELLRQHRIVREGLIAGLLGAATVALWFLLLDAAQGRIFFTPAALGSAIFYGAHSLEQVRIAAAPVLGYTVLHVAAFALAGLIAATLVTEAEHEPPLVLGLALLFVTFETLFIGLVAIVAGWLLDTLQWWTIAVGNVIAAAAMGIYLWREHPLLRRELREHPLEEPV